MRLAFLLWALACALLVSAPAFVAAQTCVPLVPTPMDTPLVKPIMPKCTVLGSPKCEPGYKVVPNSVNTTRGLTYPVGWPYTPDCKPLTAKLDTEEGQHTYWMVEKIDTGERTWARTTCSFTGNDCNTFELAKHNVKMLIADPSKWREIEQTAWDAFFGYTCDGLTARRNDWIGKICTENINTLVVNEAAWLAKMPAQARWVVAYNSACSDANKLAGTCTRPVSAYNPVTKTRSVAKGETVAVGAPCYSAVVTHKDSATSSITYMAIDPARTDRVAVCAKG